MTEIAYLPCPPVLPGANIKVVGVGGAGCNAINRMVESGVTGVQFIALNTDQQSLALSQADIKIPLGPQSMRGLGAGGDSERASNAAQESYDDILSSLEGADMVFIAGGMGGGTGTGAAHVVASCAKRDLGALAVAVVVTPFSWEGDDKLQKAAEGLEKLRDTADSVIVVSNEKIAEASGSEINMTDAYKAADSVLIQGVRGITELILRPGITNGDFADVQAVLVDSREALIGTGEGTGDSALIDAVRRALDCPLLERGHLGAAREVIISVIADWPKIKLRVVNDAMKHLRDYFGGMPNIKLCKAQADAETDKVLATILASGFVPPNTTQGARPEPEQQVAPPPPEEPRIYGSRTLGTEYNTPGRLTQQAPTPSDELDGPTGDLRVPPQIRNPQNYLPSPILPLE